MEGVESSGVSRFHISRLTFTSPGWLSHPQGDGASTSHQNSGPNVVQASHMIGTNLMPNTGVRDERSQLLDCLMAWYSLSSSNDSVAANLIGLFKSFHCQVFNTHQLGIQLCKFQSRSMSLLNSGGCSFDLFGCGAVPFHQDVRMVQVKSRTWNPKKIKPGGLGGTWKHECDWSIDLPVPWSCSRTASWTGLDLPKTFQIP